MPGHLPRVLSLALVGLCSCTDTDDPPEAIPTGAIFATLADGAMVNANTFGAKDAVYLHGGVRPGAAAMAAGLPAGDYYFQVTDPSGLRLLSEDDIACRRVRVGDDGVFELAYRSRACAHLTGLAPAQPGLGGITVQLMPYASTPSPTGVYMMWITAVDSYGGPEADAHGFVEAASKTTRFTVIEDVANPVCGNRVVETGEQCDDGNTTSDDGCGADCVVEWTSDYCG